MSRDYAEKEREFIESLKADTGRDLDGWMAAISEQKFPHRNDAIDWLRQQGFLFSWASWLERIHNNGGEPIYFDRTASGSQAKPERIPTLRPDADVRRTADPGGGGTELSGTSPPVRLEGGSVIQFPGAKPAPQTQTPPAATLANSPATGTPSEITAVIASAKAYAPLAGFLIRFITDQLPGTEFRAGKKHIELRAGPLPFALLAVGGKELKLAFAGPPDRFESPCEKVRLPNLGAPLSPLLTHMLILSDAREIDEAFLKLLCDARARVEK